MENKGTEKKRLEELWLNGVKIGDDVTVDFTYTTNVRPVPESVTRMSLESITVKVEIKSFCLPLSWLPHDFTHRQN